MNFSAFVGSLYYMVMGMVGIFLVIGIILAMIAILNRVTGNKN